MTSGTDVSPAVIEEVVLEALKELAGDPDAVNAGATLEQIDVDSLDLAELAQVVEERFGVALKGSDVADVTTVRDAIDLVTSRI